MGISNETEHDVSIGTVYTCYKPPKNSTFNVLVNYDFILGVVSETLSDLQKQLDA